jgi:hypothetical protein
MSNSKSATSRSAVRKSVKRRKSRKARAAKPKAGVKAALSPGQVAWQMTWRLKGDLKRVQRAYLRIGEQLAAIRDQKRYADLGHPDMESYAAERLGLGRASLYRYLQVYVWAAKKHPDWLKDSVKGAIPDLSDTVGLMWIDAQLDAPGLDPARQAALLKLREKALKGTLKQAEFNAFRRQGRPAADATQAYLKKLRNCRRAGARLKTLAPEILKLLDQAIEMLANEQPLKLAQADILGQIPAGVYKSSSSQDVYA